MGDFAFKHRCNIVKSATPAKTSPQTPHLHYQQKCHPAIYNIVYKSRKDHSHPKPITESNIFPLYFRRYPSPFSFFLFPGVFIALVVIINWKQVDGFHGAVRVTVNTVTWKQNSEAMWISVPHRTTSRWITNVFTRSALISMSRTIQWLLPGMILCLWVIFTF